MEDIKKRALAELLEVEVSEIEGVSYDDVTFTHGDAEYLVMTDEESQEAWDESIENYIDECVLCELPEQYRSYFDYEKFKHDCSFDGRGHSLATYDGNEEEIQIDDVWYFIYRTN